MADVSDPKLQELYQDVRSDGSPTNWCTFGYEGNNKIVAQGSGNGDFNEFLGSLDDGQCQYGFVRFITGNEESKRAKFALIAWVGPNASILKKARVSVHKANVKEIVRDFAAEFLFDDRSEIDADAVKQKIVKAGGANYSGNS